MSLPGNSTHCTAARYQATEMSPLRCIPVKAKTSYSEMLTKKLTKEYFVNAVHNYLNLKIMLSLY